VGGDIGRMENSFIVFEKLKFVDIVGGLARLEGNFVLEYYRNKSRWIHQA
jgi:hypothetical protein